MIYWAALFVWLNLFPVVQWREPMDLGSVCTGCGGVCVCAVESEG